MGGSKKVEKKAVEDGWHPVECGIIHEYGAEGWRPHVSKGKSSKSSSNDIVFRHEHLFLGGEDQSRVLRRPRVGPINALANAIHQNAMDKGFWDKDRNFGEVLMLIVSEISESLEADRSNMPGVYLVHDEHCSNIVDEVEIVTMIEGRRASVYPLSEHEADWLASSCVCEPKPEGSSVELVDALIRILDTLSATNNGGLDIETIISLKMDYNSHRPRLHGKQY